MKIAIIYLMAFIVSVIHCGCTSEVFSVLAGYPVTFSGTHPTTSCALATLDNPKFSWCSWDLNTEQWIMVSSMNPQKWIGVITQGRGDNDQWVTKYQVSYTLNGVDWLLVDNGRTFEGNFDKITRKRNNFQTPVVARAIRILPRSWNSHISLRFDAIFERI